MKSNCIHCGRFIVWEFGVWADPEATGDDSIWRETCDSHDTFVAEHEPDGPRECVGIHDWAACGLNPDNAPNFDLEGDLRTIRKWDGA